MAESFSDELKRWVAGRQGEYVPNKRRKTQSNVVCEGAIVDFDVYAGNKNLTLDHVWWTKDGTSTAAHYKDITGTLHELTIPHCHTIWSGVDIDTIGSNERMYTGPDGLTHAVPIIPQKYLNHRLHKKKTHKRKRPSADFVATPIRYNMYDTDLLPRGLDLCNSVIHTVPIFFPLGNDECVEDEDEDDELPSVWSIMRTVQGEQDTFEDPLKGINTAEELRDHPQCKIIINVFNLLHPNE
jgi:hypothetical protein